MSHSYPRYPKQLRVGVLKSPYSNSISSHDPKRFLWFCTVFWQQFFSPSLGLQDLIWWSAYVKLLLFCSCATIYTWFFLFVKPLYLLIGTYEKNWEGSCLKNLWNNNNTMAQHTSATTMDCRAHAKHHLRLLLKYTTWINRFTGQYIEIKFHFFFHIFCLFYIQLT
jgi:hypothetical protein